MTNDLLRIEEVSDTYSIPIQTLRAYRRDGQGPRSGRLAGRVVYRRKDVEAWIDAELTATASGGITSGVA